MSVFHVQSFEFDGLKEGNIATTQGGGVCIESDSYVGYHTITIYPTFNYPFYQYKTFDPLVVRLSLT